MAKPYIVERNGKIHIRIPYKDSTGKWKQKWQKADSKRHAQRLIGSYLEQRETLGGESLVNKDTLNEYLDNWLDKRARHRVARSTFEDYQRLLENHVRHVLGKKKLAQVSVTHLQDLVNGMQEKGYSPSTIRYTHSILCGAFRQAVKERLIAFNPAREVDLPKKTRKKPKAFTPEQARAFLKACDAHKHGLVFEIALITGMRPEEYLALQWPDIEFEEGKVVIKRTIRWGKWHDHSWYFGEGKTEKAKRTIPLPAYLIRKLRSHHTAQLEQKMKLGKEYQDYQLVFATERGTPYSMDRLRRRHLSKILENAELEHIRLYDLRHTCATLLLRARESLKVVSDRLGHASIKTTVDNYMQTDESMQREANAKLETLLFIGDSRP